MAILLFLFLSLIYMVMFMQLINVNRYYPEQKPFGNDVQYFQSEDGKDFYESLPLFTKKYKLCITPDSGVICSISQDASALYPAGFSVVETGNDSNLLIVFYVQIMPDDLVMQLHRF